MNAIVNTKKTSTIDEDDGQTYFSQETLKRTFLDNLFYVQGKFPALQCLNGDQLQRRYDYVHG